MTAILGPELLREQDKKETARMQSIIEITTYLMLELRIAFMSQPFV
jgi:hypothetical protein